MRMDPSAPVLVLLHRVGPYHHARFQAAAKVIQPPLLVLQTRPNSQEYPWSFSVEGVYTSFPYREAGNLSRIHQLLCYGNSSVP